MKFVIFTYQRWFLLCFLAYFPIKAEGVQTFPIPFLTFVEQKTEESVLLPELKALLSEDRWDIDFSQSTATPLDSPFPPDTFRIRIVTRYEKLFLQFDWHQTANRGLYNIETQTPETLADFFVAATHDPSAPTPVHDLFAGDQLEMQLATQRLFLISILRRGYFLYFLIEKHKQGLISRKNIYNSVAELRKHKLRKIRILPGFVGNLAQISEAPTQQFVTFSLGRDSHSISTIMIGHHLPFVAGMSKIGYAAHRPFSQGQAALRMVDNILHIDGVISTFWGATEIQQSVNRGFIRNIIGEWDPLESTCRHASLSIL